MEKEYYRYYIKIRCLLGISPLEIHKELAIGDSAPSYRTVARWAHDFNNGREDVKDGPRPGRPITTCTPTNIDRVRQLIEDDPSESLMMKLKLRLSSISAAFTRSFILI